MRGILWILEESQIAIVPTEKTNSFRSMIKWKYKTMVEEHLKQPSVNIERGKVE